MWKKILVIALLIFSILFMTSCSLTRSYKYEKRDFWINNTYRSLNYVDTTELQSKTISYIVDASVAKAKNDYTAALVNYQLALRTDTTAAILYSIAECFLLIEKYDLALEYGHLAIKYEPAFLPAYEVLCKAYSYLGDIRNAILTLENALLMTDNEPMLYFLANLYEMQESKKAITTYKKLVADYKNKEALWRLINIYRSAYDAYDNVSINNMADDIYAFWQQEPDDYDLTITLINVWLQNNNADKFFDNIDEFEQNLTAQHLENLYNYVLYIFLKQDIFPTNINVLLSKIDNRFKSALTLNINAIEVALKTDNTNIALKLADNILLSNEATDNVKLGCILRFYHANAKDTIANKLNLLMQADKNNWKYPYWSGVLEMLDKKYDTSLVLFQKAIQLDSAQQEVLLSLASVHMSLENYNSADTIFEKMLLTNPNDPTICNNFAFSLSMQEKDLNKAMELSMIALGADSTSAEYLDTYGWIKYKQGDFVEAAKYLEKAILYYDEETPEIYNHLAEVYHKLDKHTEAKETIQKALEIEPNNTESLKTQKLIEDK